MKIGIGYIDTWMEVFGQATQRLDGCGYGFRLWREASVNRWTDRERHRPGGGKEGWEPAG
jgi:hypothetical protein